MGRAFEYRKARKLKRWGNMARTFTKIGKEISIAVKAGGPDPDANPRLRVLMQNAKAANMPKENVERAIKKASSKDAGDYKEVVYEGYGPFGIAIVVETATDNTTRTVANVRSYFNKAGGSLGTTGSLSFLFDHKCVFHIKPKEGVSVEDLELEMIDYGVDEVEADEVEEEDAEETQESSFMNEPEGTQEDETENDNLPGQQDMSDYPEYVPEPQEKGLSFTEWISKKYGIGQYNMIQKEVRKVIMTESESGKICPAEWESRLTNALSVWVMGKTAEYQKYLQG